MKEPRSRIRTAAAFVIYLASVSPVFGQTVTGVLVEEESGEPVSGAILTLVDESGADRSSTLTDADGGFRLTARSPGLYVLRAQRIGYADTASPPFSLAAGQTLSYRMEAPVEAIELSRINVAMANECILSPSDGDALTRVWQEARKALTAAELTREMDRFRFTMTQYDRELDPRTRWIREQRIDRQEGLNTDSPFVSRPAEELAEKGYVRLGDEQSHFYAPDAEVLLSDSFLEEHCFRLNSGDVLASDSTGNLPGRIGLAFEPTGRNEEVDIAGFLWLDRVTAELDALEYRYVGLPWDVPDDAAGGRVEFRRLPTGSWIVDRWWVRAPIVQLPRIEGSEPIGDPVRLAGGHLLVGIVEAGGEVSDIVLSAGVELADASETGVSGTITDSTLGSSLAGAHVILLGADRDTWTAPDGRYRIAGLLGGTYRIEVRHPRLDSLGIGPLRSEARIEPGRFADVDLAAPSLPPTIVASCGKNPSNGRLSAITGTVTDEVSGSAAPGADVVLEWNGERVTARVDGEGRYVLCDVPRGTPFSMRAEGRAGVDSAWLDGLYDIRVALVDFALTPPATLSTIVLRERNRDARDDAAPLLAGKVIDAASGRPLAGAQISIPDSRIGAVADAGGGFQITGLPAGSQLVIVEHLGYAAAEWILEVAPNEKMAIEAALVPQPIEVAEVAVGIPAGADAEHTRFGAGRGGYQISRQQIQSYPTMPLHQLIARFVPGLSTGVSGRTGCPTLLMRGSVTLGEPASPLVIVEGMPLTDTCQLDHINSDDIESIEFLTGSGAAPYGGSRAAAGVIRITINPGGPAGEAVQAGGEDTRVPRSRED